MAHHHCPTARCQRSAAAACAQKRVGGGCALAPHMSSTRTTRPRTRQPHAATRPRTRAAAPGALAAAALATGLWEEARLLMQAMGIQRLRQAACCGQGLRACTTACPHPCAPRAGLRPPRGKGPRGRASKGKAHGRAFQPRPWWPRVCLHFTSTPTSASTPSSRGYLWGCFMTVLLPPQRLQKPEPALPVPLQSGQVIFTGAGLSGILQTEAECARRVHTRAGQLSSCRPCKPAPTVRSAGLQAGEGPQQPAAGRGGAQRKHNPLDSNGLPGKGWRACTASCIAASAWR